MKFWTLFIMSVFSLSIMVYILLDSRAFMRNCPKPKIIMTKCPPVVACKKCPKCPKKKKVKLDKDQKKLRDWTKKWMSREPA